MKKLALAVVLTVLAFAKANAQPSFEPETNDQKSVEETVNQFFDAFHKQDTTLLKSFFTDEAKLSSIALNDGATKLSDESLQKFLSSIQAIPKTIKFREILLEIKVIEDKLTAVAITPYRFEVNDKKSHSGTNVFVFVKLDGSWKITSITDSRIYN
ncbi:MAG: nuclear transport factor 2 family protein [Nonlabens sp.]